MLEFLSSAVDAVTTTFSSAIGNTARTAQEITALGEKYEEKIGKKNFDSIIQQLTPHINSSKSKFDAKRLSQSKDSSEKPIYNTFWPSDFKNFLLYFIHNYNLTNKKFPISLNQEIMTQIESIQQLLHPSRQEMIALINFHTKISEMNIDSNNVNCAKSLAILLNSMALQGYDILEKGSFFGEYIIRPILRKNNPDEKPEQIDQMIREPSDLCIAFAKILEDKITLFEENNQQTSTEQQEEKLPLTEQSNAPITVVSSNTSEETQETKQPESSSEDSEKTEAEEETEQSELQTITLDSSSPSGTDDELDTQATESIDTSDQPSSDEDEDEKFYSACEDSDHEQLLPGPKEPLNKNNLDDKQAQMQSTPMLHKPNETEHKKIDEPTSTQNQELSSQLKNEDQQVDNQALNHKLEEKKSSEPIQSNETRSIEISKTKTTPNTPTEKTNDSVKITVEQASKSPSEKQQKPKSNNQNLLLFTTCYTLIGAALGIALSILTGHFTIIIGAAICSCVGVIAGITHGMLANNSNKTSLEPSGIQHEIPDSVDPSSPTPPNLASNPSAQQPPRPNTP